MGKYFHGLNDFGDPFNAFEGMLDGYRNFLFKIFEIYFFDQVCGFFDEIIGKGTGSGS